MRPLGVTLIGIYQILRGLQSLLFALGILLFTGLARWLTSLAVEGSAVERALHQYGRIAGLVVLIYAILHLVTGLGLFGLKNWARLLTLLLSAVGLVLLLPVLLVTHGLALVFGIINAAIIFYLALPPVKRAFHGGKKALPVAA